MLYSDLSILMPKTVGLFASPIILIFLFSDFIIRCMSKLFIHSIASVLQVLVRVFDEKFVRKFEIFRPESLPSFVYAKIRILNFKVFIPESRPGGVITPGRNNPPD